MQISNTLIATVIGIAIALRITKKIRSRKRKLK